MGKTGVTGENGYFIRVSVKDTYLLKWYIQFFKVKNGGDKLVSIPQAISSMVRTFVDDEVVPLYRSENNGNSDTLTKLRTG